MDFNKLNFLSKLIKSVSDELVEGLNKMFKEENAIEVYEVKRELPNNDNQAETQNSDQDR